VCGTQSRPRRTPRDLRDHADSQGQIDLKLCQVKILWWRASLSFMAGVVAAKRGSSRRMRALGKEEEDHRTVTVAVAAGAERSPLGGGASRPNRSWSAFIKLRRISVARASKTRISSPTSGDVEILAGEEPRKGQGSLPFVGNQMRRQAPPARFCSGFPRPGKGGGSREDP
jgi:hypothetical protein